MQRVRHGTGTKQRSERGNYQNEKNKRSFSFLEIHLALPVFFGKQEPELPWVNDFGLLKTSIDTKSVFLLHNTLSLF